MEKDFHTSDVISAGEASPEQQIKKDDEENNLTKNPKGLDEPVFFRPFFFQF